jgi:hypothetical protein
METPNIFIFLIFKYFKCVWKLPNIRKLWIKLKLQCSDPVEPLELLEPFISSVTVKKFHVFIV